MTRDGAGDLEVPLDMPAAIDGGPWVAYTAYDMLSRLNARLDPSLAARVDRLARAQHRSTSAVVREALEQYLERQRPSLHPFEALSALGFVGGGVGPADLSTNYKAMLTSGLDAKVTPRPANRGSRQQRVGR